MSFTNRISQALHDEHRATVALMERLEALIARHRRGTPPDVSDRAVSQLLSELATSIEAEVDRHFAFEENQVFTYLDANGDSAIGAHLTDEHGVMRPLGMRVAELARTAAAQGFDATTWDEFRHLGQQYSQGMLGHVQKEEMALLPLIEEMMDAETESRLYEEYVANA